MARKKKAEKEAPKSIWENKEFSLRLTSWKKKRASRSIICSTVSARR